LESIAVELENSDYRELDATSGWQDTRPESAGHNAIVAHLKMVARTIMAVTGVGLRRR
jgi:hypothetical protein